MKKNKKSVLKLNKFRISDLNALSLVAGDDNTVIGGDDKKKSGNLLCLTKVEIACKLETESDC